MDLLELHPSFWTGEIITHTAPLHTRREVKTEKSFAHWQALRRNKKYAAWASDCFLENYDFFNGKSFFDRYFTTYLPEAGETFSHWRSQVITATHERKTSVDLEWEILAKKVVWDKLPQSLPDRWLPIPSAIEFPHPYVLSVLTKTTVGFCVSTVPFRGLTKIRIRGRFLWIDLTGSLSEIIREILAYDSYLNIDDRKQKHQVISQARTQLKTALRHRPRSTTPRRQRSRKRDHEPPRLARIFVAWDMKQDGKSLNQIAERLWPEEFSKARAEKKLRKDDDRQALLQRAQDHVKGAERIIRAAFYSRK